MGHRANLMIIREGNYSLYYSHWCAITLPSDLFWGPEAAVAFIEQQEPAEGWLDNAWAEGCACVDLDHRHLLWYGGEDEHYEIPLRRHLLKMMQPLWPGWTIEWASSGILDMAAYVGYPVEELISEVSRTITPLSLVPESRTAGSERWQAWFIWMGNCDYTQYNRSWRIIYCRGLRW